MSMSNEDCAKLPLPEQGLSMRILSCPSYLPLVRAVTERLCQLLGFDEAAIGGIVLSVDEALSNIIRHAYAGAGDRPIEIDLAPLGRPTAQLRIRLRDYGKVVDPSQIKPRDLSDIRPGGLGVHIIKQCMDHVEYSRADGGGTLLTLVKRLPGGGVPV